MLVPCSLLSEVGLKSEYTGTGRWFRLLAWIFRANPIQIHPLMQSIPAMRPRSRGVIKACMRARPTRSPAPDPWATAFADQILRKRFAEYTHNQTPSSITLL